MKNYYDSSLCLSDKWRMVQNGEKATVTNVTGNTNISNFISNVPCNMLAYETFSGRRIGKRIKATDIRMWT